MLPSGPLAIPLGPDPGTAYSSIRSVWAAADSMGGNIAATTAMAAAARQRLLPTGYRLARRRPLVNDRSPPKTAARAMERSGRGVAVEHRWVLVQPFRHPPNPPLKIDLGPPAQFGPGPMIVRDPGRRIP